MRKLAMAGSLLLTACAGAQPAIHGEFAGHQCQTAGTDQYFGQAATSENGAAIMQASHAAVLRWAPPGVMLTMDFREDRVIVWIDPAQKITQIRCG